MFKIHDQEVWSLFGRGSNHTVQGLRDDEIPENLRFGLGLFSELICFEITVIFWTRATTFGQRLKHACGDQRLIAYTCELVCLWAETINRVHLTEESDHFFFVVLVLPWF